MKQSVFLCFLVLVLCFGLGCYAPAPFYGDPGYYGGYYGAPAHYRRGRRVRRGRRQRIHRHHRQGRRGHRSHGRGGGGRGGGRGRTVIVN